MTTGLRGHSQRKHFHPIFSNCRATALIITKGWVPRQVLSLTFFNLVRFKNTAFMHKTLKQNSKMRHNGQMVKRVKEFKHWTFVWHELQSRMWHYYCAMWHLEMPQNQAACSLLHVEPPCMWRSAPCKIKQLYVRWIKFMCGCMPLNMFRKFCSLPPIVRSNPLKSLS